MSIEVYLIQEDRKNAPKIEDERFQRLIGYGMDESYPYIGFNAKTYHQQLFSTGIVPHSFMKDWNAQELKEQYIALEIAMQDGRISETSLYYPNILALREMLFYAAERKYSSYASAE